MPSKITGTSQKVKVCSNKLIHFFLVIVVFLFYFQFSFLTKRYLPLNIYLKGKKRRWKETHGGPSPSLTICGNLHGLSCSCIGHMWANYSLMWTIRPSRSLLVACTSTWIICLSVDFFIKDASPILCDSLKSVTLCTNALSHCSSPLC